LLYIDKKVNVLSRITTPLLIGLILTFSSWQATLFVFFVFVVDYFAFDWLVFVRFFVIFVCIFRFLSFSSSCLVQFGTDWHHFVAELFVGSLECFGVGFVVLHNLLSRFNSFFERLFIFVR